MDKPWTAILRRLTHRDVWGPGGIAPLEAFRRSSSGYVARCPSHRPDINPSFAMKEGRFDGYCFACRYRVSWIDHIARRLGITDRREAFRKAIEVLAARAGMPVPAGRTESNAPEVFETAARWPDERRAILTRLLALEIYGKIQQRANQLAAAARTEADVLTSILERDYADATPERLSEVQDAVAKVFGEVEVLTASAGALERGRTLAVDVRQARRDWTQASETLAGLQGDLAEAREEHFEAEDTRREGLEGLRAIEEALAGIAYDPDRHLALMRAQEQAARLAEIHRRLGELAVADERATSVIAQLTRRRDEVRRTFEEAEQSLASARALESNARRDREAIEHRVGTRATIAALLQREHQNRNDSGTPARSRRRSPRSGNGSGTSPSGWTSAKRP